MWREWEIYDGDIFGIWNLQYRFWDIESTGLGGKYEIFNEINPRNIVFYKIYYYYYYCYYY